MGAVVSVRCMGASLKFPLAKRGCPCSTTGKDRCARPCVCKVIPKFPSQLEVRELILSGSLSLPKICPMQLVCQPVSPLQGAVAMAPAVEAQGLMGRSRVGIPGF